MISIADNSGIVQGKKQTKKKKNKKKQQQQVTQSKIGGRPKQIFLQIKHTHGQQTHEKMLNISHY